MAVQNFSGGGFYGKLGVLVGQRLYDRFILRAWVKTPNPNTPAQRTARGDFSRASKRASFSLNLNPRTPQISTISKPAMAARTQIASALEKDGAEDLDLLPIFEADKTPDYLINHIVLIEQSNSEAHFQISGTLPNVERGISAAFILDNEDFEIANCKISSGTFSPSGTTYNLTLSKPREWIFDANTRMILISNDDKSFENRFLWMPCSYLALVPTPQRAFNFTILNFSRNGNIFEIEFSETYFNGLQNFSDFTLRFVSNGSWGNFSVESPTMINLNGHFGIRFSCNASNEWEIWAFPSGSKFTISALQISSADLILTAENVEVSLTSADLTRTKTELLTNTALFQTDIALFDDPPVFSVSIWAKINKNQNLLWNAFEFDSEGEISDDNTTVSGNYAYDDRLFYAVEQEVYRYANENKSFSKFDVNKDTETTITMYIVCEPEMDDAFWSGENCILQNPQNCCKILATQNGVVYVWQFDFTNYSFES